MQVNYANDTLEIHKLGFYEWLRVTLFKYSVFKGPKHENLYAIMPQIYFQLIVYPENFWDRSQLRDQLDYFRKLRDEFISLDPGA